MLNFKQRQNWSQNALQMADLVAKNVPTPPTPRIHPKMTQNNLQMVDLETLQEISKIVGDDLWFF